MTDKNDTLLQVATLLFSSIDGTISKEEFNRFEALLQENCAARSDYFRLLELIVTLGDSDGLLGLNNTMGASALDTSLWQALVRQENCSPSITIEKQPEPVRITPPKSPLKLCLISAAAMVAIAIFGIFMPSAQPIGVLTRVSDVGWSVHGIYPTLMTELYAGQKTLTHGFAEITLNSGVVVIIQAPATFDLGAGNQLYLDSGKVTASVPQQASGFTVLTPYARIVDFGTEFGVAVENGSSVGTHVFKGRVKVSSVTPGIQDNASWLTQGQAVSVDKKGTLSPVYPSQTRKFIQNIDSVENWRKLLNVNLVKNPGFEADTPGIYDPEQTDYTQKVTNLAISDWVDSGPATIYTYYSEPTEEFPLPGRNQLPDNCQRNFFIGVDNGTISQTIDVSQLGYAIDNLGVTFNLSGWLGGFADHADKIELVASFKNINKNEIDRYSLGTIDPQERNNLTGFVFRTTSGIVPVGTDHIEILIITQRLQGIADSYADNIEFSLKLQ